MKIVDINLLIYAINKDAPHHSKAKKWLEDSLSSDEPFGFAWIVILGFLRIVTNGRIMPTPLIPEVAIDSVNDWLLQPPSVTVAPSRNHWSIFKELLIPLGVAANLTSDAHLPPYPLNMAPVFIQQIMISVAFNRCAGQIQ